MHHWCPIALIVKAGSITSSIKYNNFKEGNAIKTNIAAGIKVQIISINVPSYKYLGSCLVVNAYIREFCLNR